MATSPALSNQVDLYIKGFEEASKQALKHLEAPREEGVHFICFVPLGDGAFMASPASWEAIQNVAECGHGIPISLEAGTSRDAKGHYGDIRSAAEIVLEDEANQRAHVLYCSIAAFNKLAKTLGFRTLGGQKSKRPVTDKLKTPMCKDALPN
jgi:hypothetical protein